MAEWLAPWRGVLVSFGGGSVVVLVIFGGGLVVAADVLTAFQRLWQRRGGRGLVAGAVGWGAWCFYCSGLVVVVAAVATAGCVPQVLLVTKEKGFFFFLRKSQ